MPSNNSNKIVVREVDIECIHEGLDNLQGYAKAVVFFRFRNSFVGEVRYDIHNGKLSEEELRNGLVSLAWPLWQWAVIDESVHARSNLSASVVVCTRNRAIDLKQCLDSLIPINAKGIEIVVVDNCSDDNKTAKLIEGYPSMRYIYESRIGLNIARNTGISASKGDIIAFTDDDAVVDEKWVDRIRENFADPTVAVVTGMALPLELNTQAQQWFEKTNSFKRGFEKKKFDMNNINPLGAGIVGAGVNMAIRRSYLNRIGMFDNALDGGTPTRSGGDQEFFYRTLARGFRIVYDPQAVVWHRHRSHWHSLRRVMFGYGVGLFAWWTRAFFLERESSLLRWGSHWFIKHHVANLVKSILKRPNRIPLDLTLAEFIGAILGPFFYLRSYMKLRNTEELGETGKQT